MDMRHVTLAPLLIWLGLWLGTLTAQPTLTRASFPSLAGSFTAGHLTDQAALEIDPNPVAPGADVTWDFRRLATDGRASYQREAIERFVDPAHTSHAAPFPRANYCMTDLEGNDHRYYELTDSALRFWGEPGSSGPTIIMTDPQVVATFPLSCGSADSNRVMGTLQAEEQLSLLTGTAHFAYDGYGTLLLPTGTHANVIRLVSELRIATPAPMRLRRYWWLSTEGDDVLLMIAEKQVDGLLTHRSVSYNRVPTPHLAAAAHQLPLELFPDPAEDDLTLSCLMPQRGHYAFYDMNGHIVQEATFTPVAGEVMLSVAQLPTGLYTLEVTQGHRVAVRKLWVRHANW